jgi:hypothetical protein
MGKLNQGHQASIVSLLVLAACRVHRPTLAEGAAVGLGGPGDLGGVAGGPQGRVDPAWLTRF